MSQQNLESVANTHKDTPLKDEARRHLRECTASMAEAAKPHAKALAGEIIDRLIDKAKEWVLKRLSA